MANIKSLSDLNGEDGDDNGKHNDYYAGGEKRHVKMTDRHATAVCCPKQSLR